MKLKFGFLMLAALFFMASCGGEKAPAGNVDAHAEHDGHDHGTPAESMTYAVDVQASNIRWEGGTSGVTVYSHFGNIDVQEGSLTLEGDQITGGSFVVDMLSIDPQDNGYSEEHPKEQLVGHLSTGDFFLTEEFPTASFEITSVTGNTVTGNLTVKGITNSETINLETIDVTDHGVHAVGTLVFDRQKYDVKWAHYLKDVLLKDDIELQIDLVASK